MQLHKKQNPQKEIDTKNQKNFLGTIKIADKSHEKETCMMSVLLKTAIMSDKHWVTSVWINLSKCHQ